jgi:hypothetical protein
LEKILKNLSGNTAFKESLSNDSAGAPESVERFEIGHIADTAAGDQLNIRKFHQNLAIEFDGGSIHFTIAFNIRDRYLIDTEFAHIAQEVEDTYIGLFFQP